MSNNWKTYKKLHRWPGLIISFILLYYGITGIFMNHRETFSGIDVSREVLPDVYKYHNWNNAAIKGNLVLNKDSILVFGNIGIWLTDSAFKQYKSFNAGFPKGSDNRKIFDVFQAKNGNLYAATLLGLYAFDVGNSCWKRLKTGTGRERFVGIEGVGDTIYAINRSFLYKGKSNGEHTVFTKVQLAAPEGYVNQITLFQTVWQIHSGEIFGLPGKFFIDLLGLVTVFLSITGMIYFFFPGWLKRRLKRNKPAEKIVRINRWSLKWHNKIGAWTYIPLIILFFTGIFLRPPLLLTIASANVAPVKFSHLDQPNPWYDKLRDLMYDAEKGIFIFSTFDGMYYMDRTNLKPISFQNQPPVSVMGINTLEQYGPDKYLIGSFSGLFLWNPSNPKVLNFIDGTIYQENSNGRPIGDYKISGTIKDVNGKLYMADYDKGILPLWHDHVFPEMPENVRNESKMSLWNLSLEIHTGRFFQDVLGLFYILMVPLSGIAGIIVVLSGYILWKKKYKKSLQR
jgi:hypothetical protein